MAALHLAITVGCTMCALIIGSEFPPIYRVLAGGCWAVGLDQRLEGSAPMSAKACRWCNDAGWVTGEGPPYRCSCPAGRFVGTALADRVQIGPEEHLVKVAIGDAIEHGVLVGVGGLVGVAPTSIAADIGPPKSSTITIGPISDRR